MCHILWIVGRRQEQDFVNCHRMLNRSLERPTGYARAASSLIQCAPKISNSDQGSQFTRGEFTGVLLREEITISMDGRVRGATTYL